MTQNAADQPQKDAAPCAGAAVDSTEAAQKEGGDKAAAPGGGYMTQDDIKEEQRRAQSQASSPAASITPTESSPDNKSNSQPSKTSALSLSRSPKARSPAKMLLSTADGVLKRGEMPGDRLEPPATPPAGMASSSSPNSAQHNEFRKRTMTSATARSASALHDITTSKDSSAFKPSHNNMLSKNLSSTSMKRSTSPISPGSPRSSGSPPRKQARFSVGSSRSPSLERDTQDGVSELLAKSRSISSPRGSSPSGDTRSSTPPIIPATAVLEEGSTAARRYSPSARSGRSLSPEMIGPMPEEPVAEVDGTPISPPSQSASSSSPVNQPSNKSTLRRVKVYALYESSWIDLGTGSCTFHRGVAVIPSIPSDRAIATSPPEKSSISITGMAARKAAGQNSKGKAVSTASEIFDEAGLMLVEAANTDDTDSVDGWPSPGILSSLTGPGEGEAAWIEIRKEGRWKTDPPEPNMQRCQDKAKCAESDGVEEAASSNMELDKEETDDNSPADDWERIWATRLEKPNIQAQGGDIDLFSPQMGSDETEEVIGRYRRQQETLIVWKSTASETELALSFAATAGCAEVWDFLKDVHSRWEAQYIETQEVDDDMEEESQLSQSSSNHNRSGFGLGIGGVANALHAAQGLPEPTLANLQDVRRQITVGGLGIAGRERLSALILRTEYIKKLFPLFNDAEDLESLSDLHALCQLLHAIINLNDHALWDYMLDDDVFLDIISILEYDPDFPNMKATYREQLSNPHLFKEVVPIDDFATKLKIHQIYRMQYLKDVILHRVLDDSAFSIINSFIYFHQVDIVQHLAQQEDFWEQFFAIFAQSHSATQRESTITAHSHDVSTVQRDAIGFLQAYCQMVKLLQPHMRMQALRALSERGLHRIVEYSLSRLGTDYQTRTATVEMLMLLADHDAAGIRAAILKQADDGKKTTLMTHLIQAFHSEADLGLKTQLCEQIRILLMPIADGSGPESALARLKPEDPNLDKFLQHFYETEILSLVQPLLRVEADALIDTDHSSPRVALYSHLCDILCFCVTQHTFRSKFFILSSPITSQVATLLAGRYKHVRLAALRFFRACVGRNDEFYNRYLAKNKVFKSIIALCGVETKANNLLASACLEFFEFLRVSNVRTLISHVMEEHAQDVKTLALTSDVFSGIVSRWEQNSEPPPTVSAEYDKSAIAEASSGSNAIAVSVQRDEEEDYFATDDENGDLQEASPLGVIALREDEKPLPPVRRKIDGDEEDDDLLRLESQTVSLLKPVNKSEGQKSLFIADVKEAGKAIANSNLDDSKTSIRLPDKRKRDDDNDESDLSVNIKRKAATPLGVQKKSTAGSLANKIKVIVDR